MKRKRTRVSLSLVVSLVTEMILLSYAGVAQESRSENGTRASTECVAVDARVPATKEPAINSRDSRDPVCKGTKPSAAETVGFLPVDIFASTIERNAGEPSYGASVSVPTVSKGTSPANKIDDRAALAKKLRNPVSSLASLSFRNSVDFGLAADRDGWRYTMSLEPVFPIPLNKDWNLISRTILPFIQQKDVVDIRMQTRLGAIVQSDLLSSSQKSLSAAAVAALLPATATNTSLGGGVVPVRPGAAGSLISGPIQPSIPEDGFVHSTMQSGLGDIVQSFLLSPSKSLFWGAGAAFLLPTATDTQLGTGKFGVGPTLALGKQQGGWTWGGLARQIWSVAGHGDRADVNSTFVQPFVAYTTRSAWTYSLDTEATYDWVGKQWSVPVHLEVTKVLPFGRQPVSVGAAVTCWAATLPGGPQACGVRFVITPLFAAR